MSEKTASIVFFRMSNRRYRNDAITRLKKERIGSDYAAFWNSTMSMAKELDTIRNQVDHWHFARGHRLEGEPELCLKPAAFWHTESETPQLTAQDSDDFANKANYLADHFSYFAYLIRNRRRRDANIRAPTRVSGPSVYTSEIRQSARILKPAFGISPSIRRSRQCPDCQQESGRSQAFLACRAPISSVSNLTCDRSQFDPRAE